MVFSSDRARNRSVAVRARLHALNRRGPITRSLANEIRAEANDISTVRAVNAYLSAPRRIVGVNNSFNNDRFVSNVFMSTRCTVYECYELN